MDFKEILQQKTDMITKWINELLPQGEGYHKVIFEAADYSIQNGGKRIRPLICAAVCEMLGGNAEDAKYFACAVEFIHTYSLIHDDLPCMDDDDFRRGKPSNHKVYGEAIAVLAGDGLLTYAFETAATAVSPNACAAVSELAKYAGFNGMIGGQVIDMGVPKSTDELFCLHKKKTGALICSAAHLGALAANASPSDIKNVTEFAENLGIAFQIKDDILDVEGDEKLLGKPVGSDEKSCKKTFIDFYGIEAAKKYLDEYTEKAKAALSRYGESGEFLRNLCDILLNRNY